MKKGMGKGYFLVLLAIKDRDFLLLQEMVFCFLCSSFTVVLMKISNVTVKNSLFYLCL